MPSPIQSYVMHIINVERFLAPHLRFLFTHRRLWFVRSEIRDSLQANAFPPLNADFRTITPELNYSLHCVIGFANRRFWGRYTIYYCNS